MGRNIKQGISYAPIDVQIDSKVKYLLARNGTEGFYTWVRLLMYIYENGYYAEFNAIDREIFCSDNRITESSLSDTLDTCFNVEIFNRGLYEKYGILTSSGVQKRYFMAAYRRTKVYVYSEFLLINVAEIQSKPNFCIQKYSDNAIFDDKNGQIEREIEREIFDDDVKKNSLEKFLKKIETFVESTLYDPEQISLYDTTIENFLNAPTTYETQKNRLYECRRKLAEKLKQGNTLQLHWATSREEMHDAMLQNTALREQLLKGGLSEQEFNKFADEFYSKQKSVDKKHANGTDYCQHFMYWTEKKLKSKTNDKGTDKHKVYKGKQF